MLPLPNELILYILEFLPITPPVTSRSVALCRSNVLWAPRLQERFGMKSPKSFYAYHWQKYLQRHTRQYKQQWSMGCVGKRTPAVPPHFMHYKYPSSTLKCPKPAHVNRASPATLASPASPATLASPRLESLGGAGQVTNQPPERSPTARGAA